MKVLIVEHDHSLALALERFLTFKGFNVDLAFDTTLGLEYIYERQYDIILLDLNLHRISFDEVLRGSRNRGIKTPIIALTTSEYLTSSLLRHVPLANEYLLLPFKMDELMNKITYVTKKNDSEEVLKFGNVILVIKDYYMFNNQHKVYLTSTEIDIIKRLLEEKEVFFIDNDDLLIYIISINNKLKMINANMHIERKDNIYHLEAI